MSKELYGATLAKWRAHELASVTTETEASISGGKNPSCYSNFCPEVAYDTFRLFSSTLIRIGDDIDRQLAEAAYRRKSGVGRKRLALVVELRRTTPFLRLPLVRQTASGEVSV